MTEKPLLSKSVDTASPIVPVDPMTMTFLMLSPNFSQPQEKNFLASLYFISSNRQYSFISFSID